MIGRDRAAIAVVGEPRIARDLANAGEIGAKSIGQGLDGLGVGFRIAKTWIRVRRKLTILMNPFTKPYLLLACLDPQTWYYMTLLNHFVSIYHTLWV